MNFWQKLKSDGAALLPNCREATRAQSERLDRPLPRTTRIGLWLHLLLCRWCRRYGTQIRFLGRAAHDHQDELAGAAPTTLSVEARQRIKQRLHEEK
jgi:hypothetical protein